jgi:hypothetical protein
MHLVRQARCLRVERVAVTRRVANSIDDCTMKDSDCFWLVGIKHSPIYDRLAMTTVRNDGLSYRAIGKQLGCYRSSVQKIILQNLVP